MNGRRAYHLAGDQRTQGAHGVLRPAPSPCGSGREERIQNPARATRYLVRIEREEDQETASSPTFALRIRNRQTVRFEFTASREGIAGGVEPSLQLADGPNGMQEAHHPARTARLLSGPGRIGPLEPSAAPLPSLVQRDRDRQTARSDKALPATIETECAASRQASNAHPVRSYLNDCWKCRIVGQVGLDGIEPGQDERTELPARATQCPHERDIAKREPVTRTPESSCARQNGRRQERKSEGTENRGLCQGHQIGARTASLPSKEPGRDGIRRHPARAARCLTPVECKKGQETAPGWTFVVRIRNRQTARSRFTALSGMVAGGTGLSAQMVALRKRVQEAGAGSRPSSANCPSLV